MIKPALSIKPIKPKRISDQVFDQLRESIFRGEFKPGDKIMTERKLAEAMGVSRTSIREAINKLVVMGLLEQKQGQGTFVRIPTLQGRNPVALAMEEVDATLVDLLEVRMGLECNSAGLAALRAEDADIDFLEKSIEEMKDEVASGRLGTEADVTFHMAVAYAAKNPLQIHIMKTFYDVLFVGIKENLVHLYEDPANIERILSQHTEILHAIQAHDPTIAFAAMERHIRFVQDFFKNREL